MCVCVSMCLGGCVLRVCMCVSAGVCSSNGCWNLTNNNIFIIVCSSVQRKKKKRINRTQTKGSVKGGRVLCDLAKGCRGATTPTSLWKSPLSSSQVLNFPFRCVRCKVGNVFLKRNSHTHTRSPDSLCF